MAAPSLHVWLGQESAIDATPSWVDISLFVRLERGVTVTRGSTRGGGSQPGTASLTLDNTDSRFTVGNTGSPYYPYVHLQSLVKIERDGRPWFIGRIQSMPLFWPNGGDTECYVTVTLADRLARFNRMSLDSFAIEEMNALAPTGFWPMVEASGSTSTGNRASLKWPLTLSTPGDGTIVFGSVAGPSGEMLPQFTPGTIPAVLATDVAAFDSSGTSAFTLTATFSTTLGGLIARVSVNSTSMPNMILDLQATTYLGNPGIMFTVYYLGTVSVSQSFYPSSILDGISHGVTVVIGAPLATHPDCYIDGSLATPTVPGIASALVAQSVSLQVGSGAPMGTLVPFLNFTGTIGYVAMWPRALSAAEISRIDLAIQGTTMTAQAAMLKVLSWRNQTNTAIDAGVTDSVSSAELGKGTLASVLGAISASEAGTLYVSGGDVITWKNRRTALSPLLTLTAADVDSGVTYNCDIQSLVTVVSATQNGTTAIVRAADVLTIGEINGSVSSVSTIPGDAADHASWIANASPRGPYIGSLKVDLATLQATPLAAAITGDILAGVTLTGMPSQTPPNSTKLEIVGTSETVSATSWEVTWSTLPAGLGSARDLLILDDATYGVLDSTHRLAY